jgi:hypothetical protein
MTCAAGGEPGAEPVATALAAPDLRTLIADGHRHDEAMTPGPWRQEYAWNNAGMPTADFAIPGHNGGATVEMLADDAAAIVWLRTNLRPLLDALEAAEAERAQHRSDIAGLESALATAEHERQTAEDALAPARAENDRLRGQLARAKRAIDLFSGVTLPDPDGAMEAWLEGHGPEPRLVELRIATLETALRGLVDRIRRDGGYASPEDQDALWAAEAALAGRAPERQPQVPGEQADRWKIVVDLTAAAGPIPWSAPDGDLGLADAARQWVAADAAHQAAIAEARAANDAGAAEVEQISKPGWWADPAARERHREILARHAAAAEQVEQARAAELAALDALKASARATAARQNGGVR